MLNYEGRRTRDTASVDVAAHITWCEKKLRAKNQSEKIISDREIFQGTFVTLAACGPFCPWTISNSTLSPSCKLLYPSVVIEL
jgi:hypothetical protein